MIRRGTKPGRRRGQALLEFTLIGIPFLFMTLSIISVSLNMFQFDSLPYAVDLTARYVSTHGEGCSQNGNTCLLAVSDVVSYFSAQGMGLEMGKVALTLTDSSGTITCSPLTSCSSSSATFPATTSNSVGSDFTINARYLLSNPMPMMWGNKSVAAGRFNVGATARQRIIF